MVRKPFVKKPHDAPLAGTVGVGVFAPVGVGVLVGTLVGVAVGVLGCVMSHKLTSSIHTVPVFNPAWKEMRASGSVADCVQVSVKV